ncbi:hypothetical protein LINPERPRIM_LOCUS25693 [Linum perenne]
MVRRPSHWRTCTSSSV